MLGKEDGWEKLCLQLRGKSCREARGGWVKVLADLSVQIGKSFVAVSRRDHGRKNDDPWC